MSPERLELITRNYEKLRVAVVGDFCLDRYLEIDPSRQETSIETGLAVHNVVNVRAQPGGAGTILNNLVALGVGTIYPFGFAGIDGEGFELVSALKAKPGVRMDYFVQTPSRRTFTYCKPLLVEPGKPPRELNRLDSKNWTPTPQPLQDKFIALLFTLSSELDAIIVLDQVDVPETGVVTSKILKALGAISQERPDFLILADSRRGLKGYPQVCFKMNRSEFAAFTGTKTDVPLARLKDAAHNMARAHNQMVFITLAEEGIIGASPEGEVEHSPALPIRGEIDIVGAGDAVTANLAVALAAGATLKETLQLASAAASVVIHQLGTTGTASVVEIAGRLALRS